MVDFKLIKNAVLVFFDEWRDCVNILVANKKPFWYVVFEIAFSQKAMIYFEPEIQRLVQLVRLYKFCCRLINSSRKDN